jgi:kynureninase
VENIRRKSVRQTSLLIDLAQEAGFTVTSPKSSAERGGTITVIHEHAAAITSELVSRDFIVDFRPGAGVRISPHFYTTDEELALIIEEMKTIRDTRAYARYEAAGAAF